MKKTLLILALLACGLLLCACAAANDTITATAPPATTQPATDMPDVLPMVTDMLPRLTDEMLPSPSAAPTQVPEAAGVTSMDKARRAVEQIEEELERLSEVDDAQVVIAGNRAAVALEFDDQYKGGIDERLRGIVRERINGVISGVTDVAITADATLMDALETLGDRLDTMSDMTALENDLDAIIRKITGA